jgi:hypothetical protein
VSKFDEIRDVQTEGEQQPRFEPTIGCPTCHGQSGLVIVGRQNIYYCAEHKVFWLGLLIPWAEPFAETDETQRREWNEAGLENFEQVTPWILGTSGSSPLSGRTLKEIKELAKDQQSAKEE